MKVIMKGQPAEPQLQHFSHPHPLILSNIAQLGLQQQQQQLASSCACCKLKVSASGSGGSMIYSCIPCNYYLHVSFSQFPQQITHPFDHQNHVLVLLPTPTYPDGVFNCNACMKHGNGFSYHCGACNIDLHAKCASMPMMIQSHHSHPHHPLTLSFTLPPGPTTSTKSFLCGICHQVGYKEWLYLCSPCTFAAHLACATAKPRPPPPTMAQQGGAAVVGTPYSPRHHHPQQQFQNYQPQQPNTNYNINGNGGGGGTMIQQPSTTTNKARLGKSIVNTALTALIGFPLFNVDGGNNNNSSSRPQPRPQPRPQQQFIGGGRGGVYVGSPGNVSQQYQFLGGGRGRAQGVYLGSPGGGNNQFMGGGRGRGGGRGAYVGSPVGNTNFNQNQFVGGRGRGGGRVYAGYPGGNNVNYQQQYSLGGGRGVGGAYGGPAGGGAYGGGSTGGGGAYSGPAGGGGGAGGAYGGGAAGGGGPVGGDNSTGNDNYNVDVGVGVDFRSSADPSYTVEYSTDTTDYYYNCGTEEDVVVGDATCDYTYTTDYYSCEGDVVGDASCDFSTTTTDYSFGDAGCDYSATTTDYSFGDASCDYTY